MQVGQRAIGLLVNQRREGGQVGGQDRPGAVALGARGDFPRFAPALFEPPHPGGTDMVVGGHGRRGHPGVTLEQDPFAKIHGIGAH